MGIAGGGLRCQRGGRASKPEITQFGHPAWRTTGPGKSAGMAPPTHPKPKATDLYNRATSRHPWKKPWNPQEKPMVRSRRIDATPTEKIMEFLGNRSAI